jgi:type III pantothenate kinase
MDINVLALNLGNTRLSIGAFVAGELKHVHRVPHAQRGDWPRVIEEAWALLSGRVGASVAGASVNAPLVEPIEQVVEAQTGQKVQWVGRQIDIPIPARTNSPEQTGVDRILSAAAAFEQMGKGCIVVDAGTAITVDCCNDAGEFVGGAIAPGLAMQLDALHERTAGLPRVQFEVPAGSFGTSTRDAILQGVFYGIRGMIKELAENYATSLGYWPDIIATGGDAQKLFEGWELIHAIAPDLTLYGIALAYANHHIKHGT